MKAPDARRLRQRKDRIRHRRRPRNFAATEEPVFAATDPHDEVSGRLRCAKAGGIGAIHALAKRIGLVDGIDEAPQPASARQTAVIDGDGTVVPTTGEKKEGMSLSDQGIWGDAPLVVSLANFREPLDLVNRPGNAPSHRDAAAWIDQAIALCRASFASVRVRGDTDFSLTRHFDRWDASGVRFVFGYDAKENLKKIADSLPDSAGRPLERRSKHEVATAPRAKRPNAKERVVVAKRYRNLRLVGEEIAEVEDRPGACKRPYGLVIVRKNLSVERGGAWLWDE